MSHFPVIVISTQPLNEDTLAPILQPYHEYECTGVDDEYVVDVDVTEEVAEEFAKPQDVVVLADGSVRSRWSEQFYTKEPVLTGNRLTDIGARKEFELPEGAKIVEGMPAEEARKHGVGYATMAACAEEYFSIHEERDGKFYNRTNPDKKWDWWVIGGRWSGMFEPNYDPALDEMNGETCFLCSGSGVRKDMVVANGCNGCRGTGTMLKHAPKWRDIGNVGQIKDIPFEALRNVAEYNALKEYDKGRAAVGDMPLPSWDKLREEHGIEAARKIYHEDPAMVALKAAGFDYWNLSPLLETLAMPRDEVATRARRRAVTSFAVVKDGKWYQKGEMGWWACVSNDKKDAWDDEFAGLLDGLSPETWLAVVDCHI